MFTWRGGGVDNVFINVLFVFFFPFLFFFLFGGWGSCVVCGGR